MATAPPVRRGRRRTLAIIVILLIGIFAAIWWLNHRTPSAAGNAQGQNRGRGNAGGRFTAPPLPVSVATASKGDIKRYLHALGTITPLQVVTIRTQISGQLVKIGFQEGQLVKKGDLLATIDSRPFEVALAQAEGQVRQAQAQLTNARRDLARYETLTQEDSVAKQLVDTTQSQVTQFEGLVQTGEAAIASARLNLIYCHITAPLDGRVGLRLVDAGNYVTPSDTAGLAVLTQIKPISVLFTLPEDNITEVVVRLRSGDTLPVDALDRTETRTLATGHLVTLDNQIDPTTGTVKLRAEFPNEDDSLFPNQFVNIRLLVDTTHDAIVIPTSAIERGQDGTFVYTVQPDSTVTTRAVTLGVSEGERVAVRSGLAGGERVVTDGADKLKDGMPVIVLDPAAKSSPNVAPSHAGRGGKQRPASSGPKS